MKRKARAWPGRFDLSRLGSVRTVRDFDERFTAPHHGFRDADDYYHRASSLRVVDRVSVPTLVVSADDDPFVPRAQFDDPGIAANRRITVQITSHGGHCGFYARASADFDGYWPNGASSGRCGNRWRRRNPGRSLPAFRTGAASRGDAPRTTRRPRRSAVARRPPGSDHPEAGSASTNCRANSGPFPLSSCLKYTNTSRQPRVPAAIVSAHRAMSSGRYPSSRNRK